MRKLKKGDEVIVLTGKDKGKRGTINQVIIEKDRVVVGGVNMVKKHQKPNPAVGAPGGIVEKEMPLHISNVAIFNAATGKADRVGIKTLEDGRKVRIFKSNNEAIDA
jgi:large subunit ribosomal protein L24